MGKGRDSSRPPSIGGTGSGVKKAARSSGKRRQMRADTPPNETDEPGPSLFDINSLHATKRARRYQRSWEERVDYRVEKITSFQILFNVEQPSWHEVGRVLLSTRLPRSYIYEDILRFLGYTYVPLQTYKRVTPFGILQPCGFACIHVRWPTAIAPPFLVDFLVLPGSVPQGGVTFILGKPDIPGDVHNPNTFHFNLPPLRSPEDALASIMSKDALYLSPSMGVGGAGDSSIEANPYSDIAEPFFNHNTDTDDPDIDLDAPDPSPQQLCTEREKFGTVPALPWKLAFTWDSQRLLFDGDELPTGQKDNSVGVAQVGGSSASSRNEDTIKEKSVSMGSEGFPSGCPNQGQIGNHNAERIELLVNLLEEHYWRTHPAQRGARKRGSHGSQSASTPKPASSPRDQPSRNTPRQAPSKKGKEVDKGSGSGGDGGDGGGGNGGGGDGGDGGDSGGGGNDPPSGPPGNGQIQDRNYFACQYLKWKPWPYHDSCSGRFRSVSHVIGHLRSEHYSRQCPRCHQECKSLEEKNSHIDHGCPATRHGLDRPAMISEDQWARISKRPDRNSAPDFSDPETRWYYIYDILFPQSARPASPYILSKELEVLYGLVAYFEREGVHELRRLQHELPLEGAGAQSDEFLSEERLVVRAALFQRLLPQIILGYTSEVASGSGASHNSLGHNRTHFGDMPSRPDLNASGASHASIHTPQAAQAAASTLHRYRAESTRQSEGPTGVTSPTSIGLTTGTTDTERMDCSGDSAQAPEDKADLIMFDDFGHQWQTQVSDTTRQDDPNPLRFVAAWNETCDPDILCNGTGKDLDHNPYTSTNVYANANANAYNNACNGYDNAYANTNATNANPFTINNLYTNNTIYTDTSPNLTLFSPRMDLTPTVASPQEIHAQNWQSFSIPQAVPMTSYPSAQVPFPSHPPALPYNQISYDGPQPLSLGVGSESGTGTAEVTGFRSAARDLTLTAEYPVEMEGSTTRPTRDMPSGIPQPHPSCDITLEQWDSCIRWE